MALNWENIEKNMKKTDSVKKVGNTTVKTVVIEENITTKPKLEDKKVKPEIHFTVGVNSAIGELYAAGFMKEIYDNDLGMPIRNWRAAENKIPKETLEDFDLKFRAMKYHYGINNYCILHIRFKKCETESPANFRKRCIYVLDALGEIARKYNIENSNKRIKEEDKKYYPNYYAYNLPINSNLDTYDIYALLPQYMVYHRQSDSRRKISEAERLSCIDRFTVDGVAQALEVCKRGKADILTLLKEEADNAEVYKKSVANKMQFPYIDSYDRVLRR